MPLPVLSHFKHSIRRARRAISFHRPQQPLHPQPPVQTTHSFPNLTPYLPTIFDDPPLPPAPTEHDIPDALHIPSLPPAKITASLSSSAPADEPLRRISSSQRIPRLLRRRPATARSSSFGDAASRPWVSASASLLSPRSNTDDALWSRLLPRADREARLRRLRLSSYSCADFDVSEQHIVEIGDRLPDRRARLTEEDVFGRRRRDRDSSASSSVLACDVADASLGSLENVVLAEGLNSQNTGEGTEEEETIRHIDKAIDCSKGRLRKSANMTRAFRSVIRSGEGLIRKSDLIQATLNSEESKNPSMIILLDPDACEPANPGEVASSSEESASIETVSAAAPNATLGFSTSMTAKQCAATLETILREMACRVTRYSDESDGGHKIVRLKAQRAPHGARKIERKIKVMVSIREEDQIRTSVSFKRIAGLYSSRDSHIPLCADIRDRFQREWPAVVEALYIRLPSA